MSIEALHKALVAAGTSKTEQVILLIEECLRDGMGDGAAIRERLIQLGYNGQFVGIQLSKNAGSNPECHRWLKDKSGDYRLHRSSTEEN